MSNTYFQFKKFIIEQDKCAMKVCTDSCLFGAWLDTDKSVQSILDIGSGTGLLSLMMAQKTNAQMEAVEIDKNAFEQSKQNIHISRWKERIKVHHEDIRQFISEEKFDFIMSNPPFYQNEFSSSSDEEKTAKHSTHLSLAELFSSVDKLLTPTGKFAILLPYYRKEEAEQLAATYKLYPEKTLELRQTPSHSFFRYAGVFSHEAVVIQEQKFSIKTETGDYSDAARKLLQPYYLYL